MAKRKGKRGTADKVRAKKSTSSQKTNPFEIKFNKQKHDILGKKVAKHDRGMPGVSRSKAIQKRKETLLVEYKQRGKTNKMLDRRFGETDTDMSLEDKMLERFALERKRSHGKSGMYSLNEEEELTHFGQSLSEIERFENPVVSDDEDDTGKLGSEVVDEHFGGLLTKKKDSSIDGQSWKQRMEEIITKSRKHKYEKQSEQERTIEMTEKLDSEWDELLQLRTAMAGMKKMKDVSEKDSGSKAKAKADDYDIMVRELHFETKGKPTNRMKTDEEIAKDDKEKLDKLENDRRRRMEGLTEEEDKSMKNMYRSADDLDDGFDFEKNVQFTASYHDGVLVRNFDNPKHEDEAECEVEEEEEAEEGNEGEEDGNDREDTDGSESDDAMGHLSDIETTDDEDEEGEKKEMQTHDEGDKQRGQKGVKGILKASKYQLVQVPDTATNEEKLKKKKTEMQAAEKELPYTFPAPETYEELLGLLEGHDERNQLVIIDRLQKLYHPSLAEGNKEKLQTLYSLLLEYVCDLALQTPPILSLADCLVPIIYKLTCQFPVPAGKAWVDMLMGKQREFSQITRRKGGRGCYPGLDVLICFRIIGLVFPTSDFKHPVVTPAMLFMGQILAQCPVNSNLDVASGLLLCSICLKYVSFAKRFVPEVINLLNGLLFLTMEKDQKKFEPVVLPFKPVGKNINLLKLVKPCQSWHQGPLSIGTIFSNEGTSYLESNEFRIDALHQSLQLILQYSKLYTSLPAWKEIFSPVLYFVKKVPLNKYPAKVKMLHGNVLEELERSPSQSSLVRQKDKPKPLKMFEPRFDEHFDGKKKRVGSREALERQKLVQKYKKETKGAIRNLRQDNQFLAREKLREQMERDSERKRKVKELYENLATQEGNYNTMKKQKSKIPTSK